MSGEFITALNLDTCKAILSDDGESWDWPCGLTVSVRSIAVIKPDSYIFGFTRLFKEAHRKHHGHIAASRGTRAGIAFWGTLDTVDAVYCSCNAPRLPHA